MVSPVAASVNQPVEIRNSATEITTIFLFRRFLIPKVSASVERLLSESSDSFIALIFIVLKTEFWNHEIKQGKNLER